MEYESVILKRLIDTYGVVGNPRYISEIIKEFIIQGKERYPELFTYQADWLAHIDEFGLNPSYTVSYTGQSIYAPNTLERPVKNAILKGSTKYRDIDTGEFLETFEEGRNLELVSVKMPVLTTTGFNLFDGVLANGSLGDSTGDIVAGNSPVHKHTKNFIKVEPNVNLCVYYESDGYSGISKAYFYDKNKNYLNLNQDISSNSATSKIITVPDNDNICYMKIRFFSSNNNNEVKPKNIIIAKTDNVITAYENYEYKTNILSTSEDVVLRGIGDVSDTLDCLTGEVTERIGEIKTNNIINEITITKRYTDKLIIRLPLTLKTTTYPTNLSCPYLLCDKLKTLSFKHAYADNTEIGVYVHDTNTDYIYMCILNSNLVSNDLDGIKKYLKANPSTIQYKLLESTVKTVDLTILDQNGQNVKQLMSFNGGTHFNTGSLEGSLIPSVSVTVETDLEETLKVCSLEGNTM